MGMENSALHRTMEFCLYLHITATPCRFTYLDSCNLFRVYPNHRADWRIAQVTDVCGLPRIERSFGGVVPKWGSNESNDLLWQIPTISSLSSRKSPSYLSRFLVLRLLYQEPFRVHIIFLYNVVDKCRRSFEDSLFLPIELGVFMVSCQKDLKCLLSLLVW